MLSERSNFIIYFNRLLMDPTLGSFTKAPQVICCYNGSQLPSGSGNVCYKKSFILQVRVLMNALREQSAVVDIRRSCPCTIFEHILSDRVVQQLSVTKLADTCPTAVTL